MRSAQRIDATSDRLSESPPLISDIRQPFDKRLYRIYRFNVAGHCRIREMRNAASRRQQRVASSTTLVTLVSAGAVGGL